MAFRVAETRYQVWTGGRLSAGNWAPVDASVHLAIDIAFGEPVDIEEALHHVRKWRRLLTQMAM